MADRKFLDEDIPALVKRLHTDEKIGLLGAPNWWNTYAVPRLGIPSVRMSDGPNGVRGSTAFAATPAQCIPCGTSMGATFDQDAIRKAGKFLAEEAKIKSSVILLGPTCNIQRNPLGGRAFESFSEDPHLSGIITAAYIQGLQKEGVAAAVKHFVGNDQEHERTAAESVMSTRALREIYLYPFMLAQKLAKPWAYMTSYGRIDGVHVSENPAILQDILRKEWGFDGIIMSDWYGTYSVDAAINAGLDLEMPGPPRWRTHVLVSHVLTAQKLLPRTLDARVANMLEFIQRQAKRNPDVVFGDGIERSRDSPEAREFCRRLAADGIVLLKNKGDILPFEEGTKRKIAIMGPNAKETVISGGGSAQLKPTYVITPFDGIANAAPKDVEVKYELGCYAHKYLPTLERNLKTVDGQPGWSCSWYNYRDDGSLSDEIAHFTLLDTRVKISDFRPEGINDEFCLKLKGGLTMPTTAPYELGLTVAGRAKLYVEGELTIDNWTHQTPGDFFYGQGTIEEKAVVDFKAGVGREILVEFNNIMPPREGVDSQPALMRGVRLGGCEQIDPDQAVENAVQTAKDSDVVFFIAGLTPEWEAEGFDRPTLHLPSRQDEVISRIAEVNPNVVVCIQAGSAVAMPWEDKVAGLLQCWYSGNEAGNAIADIIYGKVNPSGRLPLTLPKRIEDCPAYLNSKSVQGKIHYREDLYVGYKHYQATAVKPHFAFGFGLSYTTFEFTGLSIKGSGTNYEVSVEVKNTGARAGAEVVQVYVSYPETELNQLLFQLRGFAKLHDIGVNASKVAKIELDKCAFSHWDPEAKSWRVVAGGYGIHVGKSSEEFVLEARIKVVEGFTWNGV
ncbi:glycoside hydrolase family 3 protein [Cylindrobasidium torrendii FP15055 ss-10]|uniref:beta-glucosidase n=1 Tax=Cylindrobasidium torrendii FP15055 ss-10 TaxID=1314674 RepID=A0A0D7B4Y8_9AGAR|nr:glycoside hydrolase family 3 protein [Cylindrobasidium torrendii FP15055 ss-10]